MKRTFFSWFAVCVTLAALGFLMACQKEDDKNIVLIEPFSSDLFFQIRSATLANLIGKESGKIHPDSVFITDSQGKSLRSHFSSFNDTTGQFNLSQVPQGWYFDLMYSNGGIIIPYDLGGKTTFYLHVHRNTGIDIDTIVRNFPENLVYFNGKPAPHGAIGYQFIKKDQ